MRMGNARAALLSGKGSQPSLDLNFRKGTLDSRIAFTRASIGTYYDATGTMQTAASGAARFDYGPTPGGTTNWIINSTMIGAAAGTPGTLPTNWPALTLQGGLSSSVIGTGTESGLPYIDIRLFGTTSNTTTNIIPFGPTNAVPGYNGQAWAQSAYIKYVNGSLTGITSITLSIQMNSGSTGLGQLISSPLTISNAGLLSANRQVNAQTVNQGACSYVNSWLLVTVPNTTAIDITLRLGAPQMEVNTAASTFIRTTSGAAANVGAVPLGLLIEEARTNSIRNNTMVGAAAGTPGTLPTNWTIPGLSPLASSVIGTGTENGISYVDIRINGTSGTGQHLDFYFETTTNIAAAQNQVWTLASYVRLVGGSLTNVSTVASRIDEFTNVGGFNGGSSGSAIVPTSAALSTQRFSFTFTLPDASTSFISGGLILFFTNTSAIDVTLRIGLPQLELGSFATSAITTTSAAATRAADVATMPVGSWFNASAGTLAAIYQIPFALAASATAMVMSLNDGTSNNEDRLYVLQPSGKAASGNTFAAGVNEGRIDSSNVFIAGSVVSGAYAVGPSGRIVTSGGAVPFAVGVAARPASATSLSIGNEFFGSYLNGWLRRVRYWPRALANSELIAATAGDAPSLDLDFVNSTTLDPRITFTRASAGTYFDATGTLQSAATNVPRFDYGPAPAAGALPKGLLIEEARTNSVRNNTMVGAVVGTPGTLPTNWTQAQNTGIVPSVIGFGTENGIAYVDLRFNGTTAGGANNNITFDSGTIAASPSQAWTTSFYMRLVAGSLTNIAGIQLLQGDNIANAQIPIASPTSAPLATQRYTGTFTTNAGAVTQLGAGGKGIQIVPNAAPVAIDLTLRIGLPQIEQGGFATSAIQTSSVAVTRALDLASMSTDTSWFNGGFAPGTEGVEYLPEYAGAASASNYALSLDDNSGNNRYDLRSKGTGTSTAVAFTASNGVATNTGTLLTDVVGTVSKLAQAWSGGAVQNSVGNGGSVQALTNAPPLSITKLYVGSLAANLALNGWVRRVRYWPRMMPNTELQSVTT